MPAKTDYIRTNTTALRSQVEALQAALGALMAGIKQAESDAAFRDANSEEPVRANTEAKFNTLAGAVATINAISLTVPTSADFMAGYDAAVDPE